jgi:hypothetical protein
VQPKLDVVDRIHEDLTALATALAPYATEIETPDPDDEQLSETVDALRGALEVVYGQRITFKGEQRAASGPAVFGEAQVEEALGKVTGVRARAIKSGQVTGRANVGLARDDVTGVDVDEVG